MILVHLCLPFLLFYVDNWVVFLFAFFVMYVVAQIFGMSITYHKLFSHRSYVSKPWAAYAGVVVNVMFCKGSPQRYAQIHRWHHRYADTDLDPHSPVHGWFRGYFGVVFPEKVLSKFTQEENRLIVSDLFRDFPWIKKFTLKRQLLLITLFHTGIAMLFGVNVLAAALAANIASTHAGLLVNLIGHNKKSGTLRTINWPLLSTFISPAYNHCYHHQNPGSADESIKGSVDFGYLLIKFFLSKNAVK